ncbi:MAG: MBL fold metallo-hydrolase [Alphaproteobacteria bacterium]|nr:MBL fold metallo-hydrolase [Alphaproteobacteria bacterium]
MRGVFAVLAALGVLVLVLVLGVVASVFGAAPIPDGLELAPGVQVVQDGHVSVLLVDAGEAGVALVDAGNDPEATAIRRALAARGRTLADVRLVVLSHGHPDHLAGLPALPQAEVAALAAEAPIVDGERVPGGPIFRLIGGNPPASRVTRTVVDGESLHLGDVSLQAWATPGHTVGSAAWLVRGVLFLGDSAIALPDGTVDGPPWIFSDDVATAMRSVHDLAARLQAAGTPVHRVAFAHGGPVDGLGPVLAMTPPEEAAR